MKTSEVIAELQKQIEQHGDLDFAVPDEEHGGVLEVDTIIAFRLVGGTAYIVAGHGEPY